MFKVVSKQVLSPSIKEIDIEAKALVEHFQPGQFFVLMVHKNARRLPVVNFDVDQRRGIISIVFNEDASEYESLNQLRIGDAVHAIAGPYGRPLEELKKKVVVCAATGPFVSAILPVTRFYKQLGCKVIAVVEGNTKKDIILESKLRVNCQKIILTTIDGTTRRKGTITDALKEATVKKVHQVYAVGPRGFLRDVDEFTSNKDIKTVVNLLPSLAKYISAFDTEFINIASQPIFPLVDGLHFDTKTFSLNQLNNQLHSLREYKHCRTLSSLPKLKRNGSEILTKLFSGLAKNKL